ncbi:glutamine-dependent NAD(+) synthetase [Exophiala xenobiotica]|nr:glutamine-dependent NAD(+) synthetase [Exophiala xenobiotica]
MTFITVASATLPSVPLDFQGNLQRILESIRIAKSRGAKLRTGPEVGYTAKLPRNGTDSVSWKSLDMDVLTITILNDPVTKDMLVDVGMGVRHRNVRYNCRILLTYQKIFFIRPKMSLANDGLYREARHFTAWVKPRTVETYYLEQIIRDITGQKTVPIGDAVLSTLDTSVGCETCEELFTPLNPSTNMGLNGVEVIVNSSASHAELRKLNTRLSLIQNCTRKLGGIYIYANATGVDGEARMMFDGSSMILCNGRVMKQSTQFSLNPVEVITATIDLEEVRSYRSSISRNVQGAAQPEYPRIDCDLCLSRPADEILFSDTLKLSREISLKILDPMEEIFRAEAAYLWQYLTRASAAGYFLALSGGLDSATVALFVFGMAKVVLESIESGDGNTLADLRRITGEPNLTVHTPQDIVKRLLHTCFMATQHSGDRTRSRAKRLSESIGGYHSDVNIDGTVAAHEKIVEQALNFKPRFKVEGGSAAENLAKQNIQARNRMVIAYEASEFFATEKDAGSLQSGPPACLDIINSCPWNRWRSSARQLMSSANVDEALRGYLTKYDCSSGDIAPLEFLEARPSAELLPLSAGEQDDESESEMGLTYDELSTFGVLRKVEKLGPWSCYLRLLVEWQDRPGFGPQQVATKVMRFFRYYALNRHKSTVLTPSIHMSAYNPDDNRHDLRPFLYVIDWPWQFNKIRNHASALTEKLAQSRGQTA